MTIKIKPFLGAYIATGIIDDLYYVAFGSTHTEAMQKLFIKHQINTK